VWPFSLAATAFVRRIATAHNPNQASLSLIRPLRQVSHSLPMQRSGAWTMWMRREHSKG